VDEALLVHALAQTCPAQDLGALVLDDPCPYPFQDMLPAPKLEDGALDPPNMEEMGEE